MWSRQFVFSIITISAWLKQTRRKLKSDWNWPSLLARRMRRLGGPKTIPILAGSATANCLLKSLSHYFHSCWWWDTYGRWDQVRTLPNRGGLRRDRLNDSVSGQ